VEDSFPQKEKTNNNNNYQLDSSRTTDSVSYLYNQDEKPNEEKETLDFSSFNTNDEKRHLIDNLKEIKVKNNSSNNINFKKCLSIFLCIIYCLLFLTNNPTIPVKIGEERNIEDLIKDNQNKKINILINQIVFCNASGNSRTSSGFLLEFKINKIYLFRWLIGFSYFFIKCICFIYSNNENNSNILLDKHRINLLQKFSMLFFPLFLFYYDYKNNISYSKLKIEKINDKEISFYLMTKKSFSMIDYIEGLIPTLFYFLISIDYNNLNKSINTFKIKTNKEKKVI
jgi:hypothetical protein